MREREREYPVTGGERLLLNSRHPITQRKSTFFADWAGPKRFISGLDLFRVS
jgi:hypothetical protein